MSDTVHTYDKLRKAFLVDAKAAGKELNSASLILFTNAVGAPDNPALDPATLTQPAFTGYAKVDALAFGAPYKDSAGKWRMNAPSVDFICTGGTPGDIVRGHAIVKTDLSELYALVVYESAVLIDAIGKGLTVEPSVTMPE